MKWLFVLFLLFSLPAQATTFFIDTVANGCSDSNSGLGSGALSWCNPSHTVNANDTILVETGVTGPLTITGSVTGGNQATGNWVLNVSNRSSSDYAGLAHLKCVTFFACHINGTASFMELENDASFWSIEGFVFSSNGGFGCLGSVPRGSAVIHHILYMDNIVSNCVAGFSASTGGGSFGVDYIVVAKNIMSNAAISAQGFCEAGTTLFSLQNFDKKPGAHVGIYQNFGYNNINSNTDGSGHYCAFSLLGANNTVDGECVILDTLGTTAGGFSYTGLILVFSNICINSGGSAFQYTRDDTGQILTQNNTSWGDGIDPQFFCCEAEIGMSGNISTQFLQFYGNAIVANTATCCANGSFPGNMFGLEESNNSTTQFGPNRYNFNWITNTSIANQNTNCLNGSCSFPANNTFGVDPQYAAPFIPPDYTSQCAGFSGVTACLASTSAWGGTSIIAAFTITKAAAIGAVPHWFCAPWDISGNVWSGKCDVGAVKVSP